MINSLDSTAGPRARKLLLSALVAELLCAGQPALAQQAATAQDSAGQATPASAAKPAAATAQQAASTAAQPASAAASSAQQAPVTATATATAAQPVPPVPPATTAAAPAPPAATDGDMAVVSMVAERPTNRIDRQTYDVKSDASSTNGSAADALANVPSVAVDPDGSVSLRGNSNVQIYIDGKPSAMMQGDNRGAALQGLPAEDIESIEVINNPGAQFGNEAGGGPILNIVMKRTRKPGGFGVVNANYGSAGHYNASASGTYNSGTFGFQGGVNVRHDRRNSSGESERERISSTGVASRSTQSSSSIGATDSAGLNAGLTWRAGANDTFGANLSYMARSDDSVGADRYISLDDAGNAWSDYLRRSQRGGDTRNYSVGTHWDRKGDLPGETLKLDLRVSSSNNDGDSDFTNAYSVRPPRRVDSHSAQDNGNRNHLSDLSGDYERPGEQGVFKAGFKVTDNQSDFDTRYLDYDPATGAASVNPMRTNRFALDQANLALYGSYQWRVTENWGVLGGLRSEYTRVDINQITQQIGASNNYVNFIPSAFATYRWSDDTNLRFSYAHRLRRARAGELNPFVVYRDELNESSGNPHLRPSQTDSLEAGIETHFGDLESNLRGYYRRDTDSILWRRSFISDTVVLSRPENAGGSNASGLEFTLSGKLAPWFSINTSGNLAHTDQLQFDPSGAGVRRSANSLSARGRFNFTLSAADHFQVAVNAQGRSLTGQGYRQPTSTANLSLRHQFSPSLSLVMNVNDVFNSQKVDVVTDTATLKETSLRRYDGRIVYFGLSWRLGGVKGRGGVGRGSRPAA